MPSLESKARRRSKEAKAAHECEQSAKKLFRQEKMRAGVKITAVKVKAQVAQARIKEKTAVVKARGQVAQRRIGAETTKAAKGITAARASARKGFKGAIAEFKSLKSFK